MMIRDAVVDPGNTLGSIRLSATVAQTIVAIVLPLAVGFVTNIKDYVQGFRGPGKLDGSFVTWVNGAFLHAVGARAGYHVNFAPFTHRKGSKTQILYTKRRD